MEAFEALEPGDPQQVGPYRIVARLGGGGMGYVYLGRSRGGRAFAVKVIRRELARNDDFRRRFVREVASARRVGGVFTAGVVDADPEGSPAWLATVYVPGIPLDEAITAHGPWPEEPTTALAAALAEALEAIHSAGVVHRDLKPSNVLLAADGPRVIDFGISLPQGSSVTSITGTGQAIGTPGFMSPEQLKGDQVGPASDVFSLAAVLALVATGSGPFGNGSVAEVMFNVAYREPRLDGVPTRLRGVVARCLAKDPAQRPTVDALLDELAGIVNGGRHDAAFTTAGWLPEAVARDVAARGTAPQPLAERPDATATAARSGPTALPPAGGVEPAMGETDFANSVTVSGDALAGPAPASPTPPSPAPSGPTPTNTAAPTNTPAPPNDPPGQRTAPGGTLPGPSFAAPAPSHRSPRRKRSKRGLWVIMAVCGVLGLGVVIWLLAPFSKQGDHNGDDVSARHPVSSRTPTASSSSSAPPSPSASDRNKPKTTAAPSHTAADRPSTGSSAGQAAASSATPPADPPKSKAPAPSSYHTSYGSDSQNQVAQGTITWGARSVTISGTITATDGCAELLIQAYGGGDRKSVDPFVCDDVGTKDFSFTLQLAGAPTEVSLTLNHQLEDGTWSPGAHDDCDPSSGCHH